MKPLIILCLIGFSFFASAQSEVDSTMDSRNSVLRIATIMDIVGDGVLITTAYILATDDSANLDDLTMKHTVAIGIALKGTALLAKLVAYRKSDSWLSGSP